MCQEEINIFKFTFVVLLWFSVIFSTNFCLSFGRTNEDAHLTVPEILTKYGYLSETHFITTEDGYILQTHRIVSSPLGNSSTKNDDRKVIYLMHGFPSTSVDWILNGPGKALSYLLSDVGYDVWMGNTRGNRYSQNHTTLQITNPKFWRYSWHEMGYFDLPATIDYILLKTKQSQLTYIGFSQGTTMFFVMGSERPEYLKKITHMHAFAPVVYLNHTRSNGFRLLAAYSTHFDTHEPHEFLRNTNFTNFITETFCNSRIPTRFFCYNIVGLIFGNNPQQLDENVFEIFTAHVPASASSWQIKHFAQLIQNDDFTKFDYGSEKNQKEYGMMRPPPYNLKNLNIPIALYFGKNDIILHQDDVERLKNTLPNVIEFFIPPSDEFSHSDYVLAKNVKTLLYDKVFEILNKYS